ncbi:DMT family transporter [Legionella spiritensis]|uniref:DMT family transporter n=1 Tax=Legionella spiritensis TaxID=452 RepID=UPI000F6B43BC|nr:DMT family transporter [Legionella spiritensis]VEG89656.1 permeases of drug/transporter [Legionella spiritensis]
MNIPDRYKGVFFLFLSTIILSAASPVTAKLIILGKDNLENGHNPISFCNVLFAGNLIALITLALIHIKDRKQFKAVHLKRKNWVLILLSSLFAGFLTPTLYFFGLMYTNVINVVLISTMQIPMTLVSGWVFFRETPDFRVIIGAILTMAGVVAIVVLQNWLASPVTHVRLSSANTGPLYAFLASIPHAGELCVFFAVLSSTASTIIGFHAVERLPHGMFSVFRMMLGVVFFFFIASILFGWSHFADLFSGFLWKWMLFYGSVIVAFRIYLTSIGMKYATVAEVAISSSLIPVVSVFFAYLILGEVPGKAQIIGGSIILAGMFIALTGKLESYRKTRVLEKPSGFSGV